MRRLGCLTESVRYFVRPCSPAMKYQMPMGLSGVFDTPSATDGSGLASLETAQGLSFASRRTISVCCITYQLRSRSASGTPGLI
jgi:hypothetical protein